MDPFVLPSTPTERQIEWREASVRVLRETRQRRLEALRNDTASIDRATTAYSGLTLAKPSADALVLRHGFVALADPDEEPETSADEPEPAHAGRAGHVARLLSRPPATRLLGRPHHGLPTYLSLLYVHQATSPPSALFVNDRGNVSKINKGEPWSFVCGRWTSKTTARRARFVRDLLVLEHAELVGIGRRGRAKEFEKFEVLSDDGTSAPYRTPDPGAEPVLRLPWDFFEQGWHLALTPAEIATLLMIMHARAAIPIPSDAAGVAVPRSTRRAVYGLSGEAYTSIHELEEFGLIEVHDTMPNRRRGKVKRPDPEVRAESEPEGQSFAPVPYQLKLTPLISFRRTAHEVVEEALSRNPVPPRLVL